MELKKLIPVPIIQPEYKHFVASFSDMLVSSLGPKLHSVYMCGSIPKGEAIANQSDADFTIVLLEPLNEEEVKTLERMKTYEQKKAPIVTGIDLNVCTMEQVLSNPYSWGFWIKIVSVCIYGNDVAQMIPPLFPNMDLLHGLNDDRKAEYESLVFKIQQSRNEGEKRKSERSMLKKVIRSLYSLTVPVHNRWTDNIEVNLREIEKEFPSLKRTIDALKLHYSNPEGGNQYPKEAIGVAQCFFEEEYMNIKDKMVTANNSC